MEEALRLFKDAERQYLEGIVSRRTAHDALIAFLDKCLFSNLQEVLKMQECFANAYAAYCKLELGMELYKVDDHAQRALNGSDSIKNIAHRKTVEAFCHELLARKEMQEGNLKAAVYCVNEYFKIDVGRESDTEMYLLRARANLALQFFDEAIQDCLIVLHDDLHDREANEIKDRANESRQAYFEPPVAYVSSSADPEYAPSAPPPAPGSINNYAPGWNPHMLPPRRMNESMPQQPQVPASPVVSPPPSSKPGCTIC